MFISRLVPISSVVFGILHLATPSYTQQQSSPSVAISYAVPSRNLTLGEPLIVQFTVVNRTTQSVKLNLGYDHKGAFLFNVTGPDGLRTKLPTARIREGLAALGALVIQPNDRYTQALILNEWYDFSTTGQYKLEGQLVTAAVLDSGEVYRDTGFQMVIEMGPRDELALTKACDSIATQIETSHSYKTAAEFAVALSFVKDPIAVPYLRRALLAKKMVGAILARGLVSIGNAAAVQVLAEAPKAEPFNAEVFNGSLRQIQKQTSDPQIRQLVDRLLSGR